MSESCGECGAQTDREPLCEVCNDNANNDFDVLFAEVERLRAENAELSAAIKSQRDIWNTSDSTLRVELEWFRRLWAVMQLESRNELEEFLFDNPKPGSNT